MNDECWRARALIDLAALRHNLAMVREFAPGCRVMAVVKSDAYGHGMAAITGAMVERVDAFAVATLQEGIECRNANPKLPITVLSGLQHPTSLELYQQHRLDAVIHTVDQVEWFEQYDGTPLSVWIKIDTGMHRLGIEPEAVADALARLQRNPNIHAIRLMSHLANADDCDDDYSTKQLNRFKQCTDEHVHAHELERSLANSAGIMKWRDTHLDWVRPGIMLYGGSPLLGALGVDLKLKPVMQLEARLLAIKSVAADQAIGYGGTFVTASPMRVGIAGFGYGDGYPRVMSAEAEVLVGDTRARVLGRVAMDVLTLDLTECEDARVGQKVVLWGNRLSVDEVANWAGTISYELLCRISRRVPREIN